MRRHERSWWWVKEKKQMAWLLIAITMILQFQIKECVGCLKTERMGLLQLKSYLNSLLPSGEEESVLESWSDDASGNSDCCLWERVNCSDAIGGHIVHLSMNGILHVGASGSLNLSLLQSFPGLQTLDFSGNGFGHLFDPIHGYKSFQSLEELRNLDLSSNYLNNSVLPFLSAAKSLWTLNLAENRMDGVFPPNELANMTELKVLILNQNKFSSFSVPGLINLRELEELDLRYNIITDIKAGDGGVFPSSLQVLQLGSNQLSSTLNGISKICAFKNLRELDLGINALTNLPYCLGNLSRLRTLDLSKNQLNGNLSSFVSGLPSTLEYLSLLDNNFNGSFLFKSLVNQTRLTVFKLSSNVGMIQAQAESSWVPLFQLKELILWNVNLGSNIPSFLVHQHDLCYVDLSYNELTGAFPTWLVHNNTRLQTLFLNSNLLTKLQLPNLVHGLQALDISSNRIQDSIQEGIGIVFPNLTYMDFSSNHFHGTIPSSIGKMKSVEPSDIYMKNRDEAGKFDILRHMYVLNLSSNDLSGEIPIEIGNLESIRSLDLSNNHLTDLPYNISKLEHLESLDLSNNHLTGSIPDNISKLEHLESLDLSNNHLTGSIPDNISKLEHLESLDLSNNHLTGSIPDNISKLEHLSNLDLSNNKLEGRIPPQLAGLNRIGYLNVSFNNLSGKIPLGGRLRIFDETSYIGNAHLCGIPTNEICNSQRVQEQSEEDEEGFMVWFFWTCGAVYISTLLALSAFLCIDSQWSREWFCRVDLLVHHLQCFKRRFVCN